ncbi:hypothetical protein ABW19_dt0208049 [Dactylella cylindrospora]|nr:hypothetical protein ABW19_dt0208049 [Dactylella cylindrospora]
MPRRYTNLSFIFNSSIYSYKGFKPPLINMLQTYTYPPFAACSTCAIHLHNIRPVLDIDEANEKSIPFDEKSEKQTYENNLLHYQSECCGRYVCAICVEKNPRFATYCPFCPIKHLPAEDKDSDAVSIAPPSYEVITSASSGLPPPPYPSYPAGAIAKNVNPAESLIHYILPTDTFPTLTLKYSVPASVLRSHNRLWSDNLLAGRSYILIPRSYYLGPSLSPDPVQSEEESLLKRFQVKTKCVEYEIAKLYLDEAGWDIDRAVDKWKADERWEEANGVPGTSSKGKANVTEIMLASSGNARDATMSSKDVKLLMT